MDKGTIVRAVLFVLAWLNSFLASKGLKTIPVLDETTVAFWVTFVISAYTFYKHNFLGKKGKQLKDAIVKESEVLIKKVVDSKVQPPAPPIKVEQPTPAPVAQPVAPVQPTEPQQPVQETK